MTRVGNLDLASAILCEDIRQEKSEKFFLIGVFSGDIFVANIPAELPLALYMPAVARTPGKSEIQLRYSGPGKGKAIIIAEIASTAENEFVTIALPRLSVHLECEGTFKIDVSADGKRWKPIVRKKISLKEGLWRLAPSIALQPPGERSPSGLR